MASNSEREIIPALEWDWATPLYDTLVRVTMPERRCKAWLVEQARNVLECGATVIDIGCGTGTLAAMLSHAGPTAKIIGIDADPKILKVAERKRGQGSDNLTFIHGFADDLPLEDHAAEVVYSTLIFHHLTREVKATALQEIHRVLKAGGVFYLADFGPPHNVPMRVLSKAWAAFHHGDRLEDNINGRLPEMMRAAGFNSVDVPLQLNTSFGTWTIYRATKAPTTLDSQPRMKDISE